MFGAELTILLRLVIALCLAGLLGWEREEAGKSAGLRTHMLVAFSAALFVGLGEQLMLHFNTLGLRMNYDPLRIIEAVVTGISFLGAGTIFVHRGKDKIQGLTTGASILSTSAVGICIGLGNYVLGIAATLLLFIVLRVFGYINVKSKKNKETD